MNFAAVVRYSEEILSIFFFFAYAAIISSSDLKLYESGIAITSFIFPYSKSRRVCTSAFVSCTQSLPVIPTSYNPSKTRFGISCGLSIFTIICGSSRVTRYVLSLRFTFVQDLSKTLKVASSILPLGIANLTSVNVVLARVFRYISWALKFFEYFFCAMYGDVFFFYHSPCYFIYLI